MHKNISYIVKFIDSARFLANSLLHLLNNLSEGIHKIKCKYGWKNDEMMKKSKVYIIKYKYCDFLLEYMNFKEYLIEYKCLRCSNSHQQKFDEMLKEQFFNICKLSQDDIVAKSCLSLWIYGWLGKIQWNIVTCKRRFLQSLKYGRYYWSKLCTKRVSKDF